MGIIKASRKIRPSTHNSSDPYRIKCEKVHIGDILEIRITHEADPSVYLLFQIDYDGLNGNNSIHCKAFTNREGLSISWLDNIQPQRIRNSYA